MAGARDFPEMDPSSERAVIARPNFTIPNGAPPEAAPATNIVPSTRPNFTMGGGDPTGARQPFDVEGTARAMPSEAAVTDAVPKGGFLDSIKKFGSRIASGEAPHVVGGLLGKTGLVAGAGLGAYEMGSGLREGDMGRAGFGAADTAATFGLTNPVTAGPSAVYLGGRTAYAAADHFMPQRMKDELGDTVGRAVDSVVPSWMGGATPSARAGFDRIQEAENRGRNIVTGSAYIPKPDVAAPARQGTVYPAGNSTAGGGRGSVNPPMASATGDARPDLANIASLGGGTGTAVPGTTDIRKFKTADGRTLYSNVAGGDNDKLMSGKPGIQTVPGMGGGAGGAGGAGSSGLRDVAALSAENRALGGDPNALMTTPGLAYGGSGKTIFDSNKEDSEAQNLGPSLAEDRALSARQRRQFDLEERGQNKQMDIAKMNNATQRDATSRTVGATLRGQDLTHESSMYGHEITGANARARLQYDARISARDFDQKLNEFKAGRGDKAFEQKNQSEEALQKDLEARYRTTDDKGNSIPDHGTIASFRTAVDRTLPALAQQLEAVGTPETKAKAADIRARGYGALEKGDLDRLQQLHDIRGRIEQSKGIGPNQGTFVHSDNLLDYTQAGVNPRLFGGNRVVTKNGSSVSANDLALKDGPANSLFWDGPWKTRSTNLTRGIRTE